MLNSYLFRFSLKCWVKNYNLMDVEDNESSSSDRNIKLYSTRSIWVVGLAYFFRSWKCAQQKNSEFSKNGQTIDSTDTLEMERQYQTSLVHN